MLRTCDHCRARFQDELQSTLCPHRHFLRPETAKRKDAAIALIGKRLYFAHDQTGEPLRVSSVGWDGMVSIAGMAGEFAPHLFVEAKPEMAHLSEIGTFSAEELQAAYRDAHSGTGHRVIEHGDGTWHCEDHEGHVIGWGASLEQKKAE